ncbi:pseudoazurin [Roseovarius aquimarinus]|uniref:Pseudoazurin n=1 Tax=Roseovarius aquimarinus TaxID=1229156 RepID=A0ABW7IB58_9RHOB
MKDLRITQRHVAKLCAGTKSTPANPIRSGVRRHRDQKGKDMIRTFLTSAALVALIGGPALAETFEVQMLNKGSDGERMVFEPAFVQAAPGDTIRFVAADKGHNAEVNKDMLPEGAEPFAGRINEEIEVTLDVEGVYGVICKPHYAMGMVMTIAVGDVDAPADFLEGRVPGKAKERFEAQLGNL